MQSPLIERAQLGPEEWIHQISPLSFASHSGILRFPRSPLPWTSLVSAICDLGYPNIIVAVRDHDRFLGLDLDLVNLNVYQAFLGHLITNSSVFPRVLR